MAYSRRIALDVRGIHSDGIGTSSMHDVAFLLLMEPAVLFLMVPNHGECAVQLADRIGGRGPGVGRLSRSSRIGVFLPCDQLILVNELALAGIRSELVSRRIRRMSVARIQSLNLM